ncbi:MAG: hypothetical protein AVDCRST_MAG87-314, partial [uncultured Thermomicrobiales bacterium]
VRDDSALSRRRFRVRGARRRLDARAPPRLQDPGLRAIFRLCAGAV